MNAAPVFNFPTPSPSEQDQVRSNIFGQTTPASTSSENLTAANTHRPFHFEKPLQNNVPTPSSSTSTLFGQQLSRTGFGQSSGTGSSSGSSPSPASQDQIFAGLGESGTLRAGAGGGNASGSSLFGQRQLGKSDLSLKPNLLPYYVEKDYSNPGHSCHYESITTNEGYKDLSFEVSSLH